jgi:hypothetical protein
LSDAYPEALLRIADAVRVKSEQFRQIVPESMVTPAKAGAHG